MSEPIAKYLKEGWGTILDQTIPEGFLGFKVRSIEEFMVEDTVIKSQADCAEEDSEDLDDNDVADVEHLKVVECSLSLLEGEQQVNYLGLGGEQNVNVLGLNGAEKGGSINSDKDRDTYVDRSNCGF